MSSLFNTAWHQRGCCKKAPVWSCFTLNIYALMPAALTHFLHTAECSARCRRFYVASYELWVKGLLLLDIHQPEYHKMTRVSKCILLLLVFFCLQKERTTHPLKEKGSRLSRGGMLGSVITDFDCSWRVAHDCDLLWIQHGKKRISQYNEPIKHAHGYDEACPVRLLYSHEEANVRGACTTL